MFHMGLNSRVVKLGLLILGISVAGTAMSQSVRDQQIAERLAPAGQVCLAGRQQPVLLQRPALRLMRVPPMTSTAQCATTPVWPVRHVGKMPITGPHVLQRRDSVPSSTMPSMVLMQCHRVACVLPARTTILPRWLST